MTKKTLLSSLLVAGAVLVGGGFATNASADELPETWKARSVEEIKSSIGTDASTYTIVWGDTLSTISEASGITQNDLATWNDIADVNLIYAGNTLTFNGDGTVSDATGQSYTLSEESQTQHKKVIEESNTKKDESTEATNTNTEKNNESNNDTTTSTEKPSESNPVWVPEQVVPEKGHWEYGTKKVWVPVMVTVVDKPAWTETVSYTLCTFPDGKEFKASTDAEWDAVYAYAAKFPNGSSEGAWSERDMTETIEHPAETHQEDQGHYAVVKDENNKKWVVDEKEHTIPGHWSK